MAQDSQARAERAVELARQIKEMANTPREVGSEHQMAQNALAGMAVELADILLGAK